MGTGVGSHVTGAGAEGRCRRVRQRREPGAETIHGMYREAVARYRDKVALRWGRGGRFERMTYGELDKWVDAVAAKLASLGVSRGDTVGILSWNRPQWAIADIATLSLGARVVPLYPTLPPSYLQYIISDSKMSALVAGDPMLLTSISAVMDEMPTLKTTLLLDDAAIASGSSGFSSDLRSESRDDMARRTVSYPNVASSEVATIVYTSGTTGAPKGVVLTHANIVSNARALTDRYGICETDSVVSYLPLSHMFERTCGYYTFLFAGATITYAENMTTIARDVAIAKPTVLIAVPRVLEKAHAAARWRIEGDSRRKQAFVSHAIDSLNEIANRRYRGERVSPWLSFKCVLYDRLVAQKFRAAAGGRLRLIVSGGASLDKSIAKILFIIGFNVLEGYGMTEASPVISCNPVDGIRLGTVGTPLEGIEVRIGDNDEILIRGPNVMKGYLGLDEETAEAIDADGWLHSGDQGSLDKDGYLTITGRLKDLIVTSYGKNVSPRPIEEKISQSKYIEQVMVYGDNRKYLVALVVPSEEALLQFAHEHGIPGDDYAALLPRDETHELIAGEIEAVNEKSPSYERIRGFDILPEPFTLENGLLTPTLKPRRGRISMMYEGLIERLYDRIEGEQARGGDHREGSGGDGGRGQRDRGAVGGSQDRGEGGDR
jgi:long-chain acyl-CoA synthetase